MVLRPVFESETQKSASPKILFALQKFVDVQTQFFDPHPTVSPLSNANCADGAFLSNMR
jgi:hypothetical protein